MAIIYKEEEMKVIDAHVHTFPDKIAPKAVGKLQRISGITPATDGTQSDTKRVMAESRVDHSILLNIATSPGQEATINACAVKTCEEKAFTALGSVHFLSEDVESILKEAKAAGLVGIKLHPDYQGFMIDDPRVFPVYEVCASLDLPVVFHAGWDCYSPDLIHATPDRSAAVMKAFPKLKMVLAHFGGMKCWDAVEEYLIGKNVWLDTAMCASYADPVKMRRMMLKHNPQQILFGSDCPWENPAESISFLCNMDLPAHMVRSILSENTINLYGLKKEELF